MRTKELLAGGIKVIKNMMDAEILVSSCKNRIRQVIYG
jgi:hypothetical protein